MGSTHHYAACPGCHHPHPCAPAASDMPCDRKKRNLEKPIALEGAIACIGNSGHIVGALDAPVADRTRFDRRQPVRAAVAGLEAFAPRGQVLSEPDPRGMACSKV